MDGKGEKVSESEDAEQPNLKNIRGFLLKKRKPGWHKVVAIAMIILCDVINIRLTCTCRKLVATVSYAIFACRKRQTEVQFTL